MNTTMGRIITQNKVEFRRNGRKVRLVMLHNVRPSCK
uniref:Uncharacterized protein n=1 Tax=Rhizophora mucronata TaxID=61149 RepID=A0A2P2QFM9_RHIMU